jgi:F0F1-type ATP synthase delta subunit
MKYSSKQYAAALYGLLAETKSPAERKIMLAKFAAKLERNNETKLVDEIFHQYEKFRQDREKIIPVSIRTAGNRAQAEQSSHDGKTHPDFPKHIGDKKVELTVTEDQSLLAGAVITVGDYRIDNSVRRRLDDLAKVFQ